MPDNVAIRQLPTGVPGLDQVLGGGPQLLGRIVREVEATSPPIVVVDSFM